MEIKMIVTDQQKYFIANENNEICQFDHSGQQPQFSGKWKLIGFRKILPFGSRGPLLLPEEMLGTEMRYKNGNGAFVLVDEDHGTYREWGDRIRGFYNFNMN